MDGLVRSKAPTRDVIFDTLNPSASFLLHHRIRLSHVGFRTELRDFLVTDREPAKPFPENAEMNRVHNRRVDSFCRSGKHDGKQAQTTVRGHIRQPGQTTATVPTVKLFAQWKVTLVEHSFLNADRDHPVSESVSSFYKGTLAGLVSASSVKADCNCFDIVTFQISSLQPATELAIARRLSSRKLSE